MSVVRDIRLNLRSRELLRREGIREYSRLRPEIRDTIKGLLAEVRRGRLLQPAVAYETYPITRMGRDYIRLDGGVTLHAPALPAALPDAEELALAVCTIGPNLEERVSHYTEAREPLRSLLLDGIGTAAVDSLVIESCKLVGQEAAARSLEASSPLAPGMPGFPITEQWQMLNLVQSDEIGVSLTSSGVMSPQKSVSMVIGIGAHMPTWTQEEVCARCSLRKTCPYSMRGAAAAKARA